MSRWAWMKLLAQNIPTLSSLLYSGLQAQRKNKKLHVYAQKAL
jgi:hypothetical protein